MTPAIAITIDTELDNEWSPAAPRSDRNLARLPEIHSRLQALGARPTYLWSYGAVTSPLGRRFVSQLASSEGCEIGAHLHPWETPPLSADEQTPRAPRAYPTCLDIAALRAKMACLTDAVGEAAGRRPLSYRAGRWGIDGRGIAILQELGYLVDSSVTPLICWNNGGPCFTTAPVQPYFPDTRDVCRPGDSSVLEVPASIRLNRNSRALKSIYLRLKPRNTVLRALRKAGLLKPLWLRPAYAGAQEMMWLARALLRDGVPILNIMFHSSELTVGTSPYVRSDDQLGRIWERIETTVRRLVHEVGAVPMTLSEFRAGWVAAGSNAGAQTAAQTSRVASC